MTVHQVTGGISELITIASANRPCRTLTGTGRPSRIGYAMAISRHLICGDLAADNFLLADDLGVLPDGLTRRQPFRLLPKVPLCHR